MKILMVCLGNICRSPLAEGILRKKIEDQNLDWQVDSAGTGGWHVGENPDARAIALAKKYGVDISILRARQIRKKDFQEFDLIFVMDHENYANVISMTSVPEEKNKVEFFLNILKPGSNANVPDPWYDDDLFENVFKMLDEGCDAILKSVVETHNISKTQTASLRTLRLSVK